MANDLLLISLSALALFLIAVTTVYLLSRQDDRRRDEVFRRESQIRQRPPAPTPTRVATEFGSGGTTRERRIYSSLDEEREHELPLRPSPLPSRRYTPPGAKHAVWRDAKGRFRKAP